MVGLEYEVRGEIWNEYEKYNITLWLYDCAIARDR